MSKADDSITMSRRSALRGVVAGLGSLCWPYPRQLAANVLPKPIPKPVIVGASEVGAEIWQVTTQDRIHSNIYCEIPYCSRSSRRFVYERLASRSGPNRTELVAVELGTWNEEALDVTIGLAGSAISHNGILYYLKERRGKYLDLMRIDIDEGRPEPVYSRLLEPWVRSRGAISPDGRWYAGGIRLSDDWSEFGIVLVDLKSGTEEIVDRDPFLINPHPQFDPGNPARLMIQHNRGGRYSRDGKVERLVGPEGATLYFLAVPDGKRTQLAVGKPHTTPCTGHQSWIGATGSALLTVSASQAYSPANGNLLSIRAERAAQVISKGYNFNHVGVSRCGRYFSCDDWRYPYRLVVGSIDTGRSAVLCDAKTLPTADPNTHPHAYLTADLKWLIFNSNRSGHPHIYAASVPEGLLEGLSKR